MGLTGALLFDPGKIGAIHGEKRAEQKSVFVGIIRAETGHIGVDIS